MTDSSDPKVMSFQSGDPELAQAMLEARHTLDQFRQWVDGNDPGAAPMLKTPIVEGDAVVFLWLTSVRVTPTGFSAVASQVPANLTTISKGQRLEVPAERVVDWMVNDRGILHGGFSLRVARSRLDEAGRAQFDAQIGVTRFI